MAEDKDLTDLVGFLRDPRAEVRRTAVQLVEGLTGTPDGVQRLTAASSELLPALLWLLSDSNNAAKSALTSLINLSRETSIAAQLLDAGIVDRTLDYIKERAAAFPELLVMLLCNVTNLDKGSKQLLQIGKGDLEGFHMGILLSRFIEQPSGSNDAYAHVAYLLTNVTRLEHGQRILLEEGRNYIAALISQLSSANPVRRNGCATALRNICFGAQGAKEDSLSAITDSQPFLEAITRPLNGESSPAADDDSTREALAETVLILAGSLKGRQALWTINAPEILRKGYESEQNGSICRIMEQTAELFLSGSVDVQEAEEPQALLDQTAAAETPPAA